MFKKFFRKGNYEIQVKIEIASEIIIIISNIINNNINYLQCPFKLNRVGAQGLILIWSPSNIIENNLTLLMP